MVTVRRRPSRSAHRSWFLPRPREPEIVDLPYVAVELDVFARLEQVPQGAGMAVWDDLARQVEAMTVTLERLYALLRERPAGGGKA